MRGLGDFQREQRKDYDRRLGEIFQHIRATIDLMEDIAMNPYQPERAPEPPKPVGRPRREPVAVAPDRQTPKYAMMREWCALSGLTRSATYRALADGHITAIKLGRTTLIDVDGAFAWLRERKKFGD